MSPRRITLAVPPGSPAVRRSSPRSPWSAGLLGFGRWLVFSARSPTRASAPPTPPPTAPQHRLRGRRRGSPCERRRPPARGAPRPRRRRVAAPYRLGPAHLDPPRPGAPRGPRRPASRPADVRAHRRPARLRRGRSGRRGHPHVHPSSPRRSRSTASLSSAAASSTRTGASLPRPRPPSSPAPSWSPPISRSVWVPRRSRRAGHGAAGLAAVPRSGYDGRCPGARCSPSCCRWPGCTCTAPDPALPRGRRGAGPRPRARGPVRARGAATGGAGRSSCWRTGGGGALVVYNYAWAVYLLP